MRVDTDASFPEPTRLIAIDWGTSSFRARRIGAQGKVLEVRRTADGILSVPPRPFEDLFRELVGDWLDPAIPCLASGMITSRQGWTETPYVDCPASPADLVARVVVRQLGDGVRIAFMPGVRLSGGIHDVMRGEETQILGVMDEGLAVHPGTHSKWAWVEGSAIRDFATFMTGELFALVMTHSIVGRLAERGHANDEAFRRGVEAGARAAERGSLSHEIFGARSLVLAERLAPSSVESYVSALLIAYEIASAPNVIGRASETPVVFGAANLVQQYLEAFSLLGRKAERGPQDATATGLIKMARMLTWL